MGRRALTSLVTLLIASLVACSERLVPAPAATEEGAFLVHVVRTPDESLPKILTWYTGTTLSQAIVVRYNPYVLERQLEVGDRVMIPFELIANDKPYGEEGSATTKRAPNLLMGESETPQPSATPPSGLETFNDDTDPDAKREAASTTQTRQDDIAPVNVPDEFVGS